MERGASIWSLFCTVSWKSTRRAESQLVKTSSRISQLHHYSRWVFGFSVKFQNKISEHGVENKIIKAQNFWLPKPRIKTMFIICTEKQCVIHRESVPEEKQRTVNSRHRCWKCYRSGFWQQSHNLKRKTVGCFAWQCSHSFHKDSEALPTTLQQDDCQHTAFLTWLWQQIFSVL